MRDRLDELGSDTEVVLVTFTKPDNIDGYQAINQLPFPILIDPDRAVYRAYGLGRGSVWRIWGPKAAKRYLEIARSDGWAKTWRHIRSGSGGADVGSDPGSGGPEDTLQLGGDFIVGPDGTITYAFNGDGPDDRPSVDELIAAL